VTIVFVPKILAIFVSLQIALLFMLKNCTPRCCGSSPASPAALERNLQQRLNEISSSA
jgi:hypothetical protein